MKEGSSIMIEKPFSCDIDGCLMKFTNEDHLVVHKKRHDMVLNLGLAPKGNTFSDQTPTPTRFIRNCEEVGLFQDLQNVNPFEETFRKAAEAVKIGQAPILDKTFQTSAPDDTLHTPNIFPHITDLQCINPGRSIGDQDTKQCKNDVSKKDEGISSDEKELSLKVEHEPRKLILASVNHKKRRLENCDKPLIIEVQNIFNQLTTSESGKPCQEDNRFTDTISEINSVQLALKEKIKNNLQNKQPTIIQLKVPIPKSSATVRYQKSQKDKFSTFSKNSLKYESKLEKPQSGIFDLSKRRRAKKSYSGLPKERIEILERNRAAATRCREKKKSYISYLEKLSRELTESNKKLQLQNIQYRKQISELQSELLNHQNCNVAISKRDLHLTTPSNVEVNKESELQLEPEAEMKNPVAENIETIIVNNKDEDNSFKCTDNFEVVTTIFDTVEVSPNENIANNVNTKSTCLGSTDASNSETYSSRLFCEEDKLRKVYSDHSYSSFINSVNAGRRSLTPTMCKSKANPNVLAKEIKYQKVIQKNDKELFNTSLTQSLIPNFGTLDTCEPVILVSQPEFVLKAPAVRKPKSKQP